MNSSKALLADREQVLAFRLDGHNLTRPLPPDSLLKAAGACGVQNTPPGSARLALHARLADLDPDAVRCALEEEKTLLQAWSLRAAPHIFPTADAAVFTLGLLPVDEESIRAFIFGVESALDKIGISAVEVVELTVQALVYRLDGRALTKDELGVELAAWIAKKLDQRRPAAWELPSWYAPGQSLGESVVRFALPIVALQGFCCHADRRGNKAYLMLTEQWLGRAAPRADPGQARAELVRRYLHCYAPTTAEHFAEWAGIGPVQAARAWRLVEDELFPVRLDGRKTWIHQRDRERWNSPPAPSGVRFLPPGDPYLALRDRATLIPDRAVQRRVWRRSGNPGALLVDGQLLALWRPEKKGARLTLTVEPFHPLEPKIRSHVEAEAEALAPHRDCTSVLVKFQE